ncbi:hypothetical protein BCO37747_07930 [Burkholderia contaminans]|nr:hypothetical protein BCO23253_06867 [Burkholderia contaminans]VWD65094.1 hypothetical protein BCO37747_07930 [Burkholderia contaminans]
MAFAPVESSDATFGVRVSAVTARVNSLLPASLAVPAAPIGTRLMKSARAPASVNGLMLRPCSMRVAMSSPALVIDAPIAVYIIPAPRMFSGTPTIAPIPVPSSSPPIPSSAMPPTIMPMFRPVLVSVFRKLSKPLS